MKKGIAKILLLVLSVCLVFGTIAAAVNGEKTLFDTLSGAGSSTADAAAGGEKADNATATDATATDATATDATPTDATATDATPTDATPTDADKCDHVFIDSGETADSVCNKIYICSKCGIKKTVLEHTWEYGKPGVREDASKCSTIYYSPCVCKICGTQSEEELYRIEHHTWNSGEVTKDATCSTEGEVTYTCTVCGSVRTESTDKNDQHVWDNGQVITEPTCLKEGLNLYKCTLCGAERTETTDVSDDHEWDKGTVTKAAGVITEGIMKYVCTVCGTEKEEPIFAGTDCKAGDTFELGSYPQSEVTDASLLSALNAEIKGLNWYTDWTSFNFYSGEEKADGTMHPDDFMKYTDVTLDGVKYRAVMFDEYRPFSTALPAGKENSQQPANGFHRITTYWYRFDPIVWRLLDPQKMLVVCDTVIDAQSFCNTIFFNEEAGEAYIATGSDAFANDYKESSIRDWLNNDFAAAFTEEEKAIINTTALTNKAVSTKYVKYDGEATQDKLFLLADPDIQNKEYFIDKDARIAKASGYALCMGAAADENGNASSWLLRTPGVNSYTVCIAKATGDSSLAYVTNTYISSVGIRPAFCVDLSVLRPVPEYIPGDVDGDGEVSSADARLALRASVNLETLSETAALAADADNDNAITPADARLILRASVGLETLG